LPERRLSAGEGAIYADANDRIDLADKIRYLMDNPETMQTMANSGYSLVDSNPAVPRSNGTFLSLVNRLMQLSNMSPSELLKT
jgi:hypothetical protein